MICAKAKTLQARDAYIHKDTSSSFMPPALTTRSQASVTTPKKSLPMGYRILVVEDHPILLASTIAMLEASGCDFVKGAKDGSEALRLLSEQVYDLVISDLHMPNVDGVQLIESLPIEDQSRPALAIISSDSPQILSSASHAAKARGLSVLGAYQKPFLKETADALLLALEKRTLNPQPPKLYSSADILLKALEDQEIQAWFQPKYCLMQQRIVGVEALSRWQHPQLGLLLPQSFLPDIHREGLHEQQLWAILKQSITAQRYWKTLGHDIPVSVNLHTKLLDDRSLPSRLHKFVTNMEASPASICFELTESTTTVEKSSYYSGAARLRMMQFGLSQDDFGTGYSSFHRLIATPFTELKIDRSMVQNSPRQEAFRIALSSLIRLAKDLGLDVVAEGVETYEELALLRSLNCDVIQGFLVSPAVDMHALGALLESKETLLLE